MQNSTDQNISVNTYAKYCPNVYVAKCMQQYDKGEIIDVTTQYGKVNECIVFNLVAQKDGFFYYSIVRADGFNYAENRAEKLQGYAANADKRADQYYSRSQEGKDFLVLAEPIKIGHHSEKRHRALIERVNNAFGKFVAESDKAGNYNERAAYWERKAKDINLSMPESVQYFEQLLKIKIDRHEGIKSGKYPREHSYSLTYANKERKECEANYKTALKLWGE